MKFKLFAAVLLTACPLGAAHAMDVATFVAKADALEKKGMRALFSSDFKLLKGEVQTAATQLRAERDAAAKAGRPLASCPPPKSSLSSKDILTHFRAILPAQRARLQVKDGLRGLLARKYPCR
jgi:hypothetical protein